MYDRIKKEQEKMRSCDPLFLQSFLLLFLMEHQKNYQQRMLDATNKNEH